MAQAVSEKNFEFFLKNDFSAYKENEWIAICEAEVVAHGEILKEVIKKAKESCKGKPLFTRVKKAAHYLYA